MKAKLLSRVRLLATPWTAAYQAPLSMGFARQEYWSGVPLPSLQEKNVDIFGGEGTVILLATALCLKFSRELPEVQK